MKKRILLIIALLGFVAVQAQSILLFEPASAHRLDPTQLRPLKATLSTEVTVRAAGRGNPWINLGDGRDLETSRTSAGPALLQEGDLSTAIPVALTSGDFDADGAPDLVAGYAAEGDRGIIILHRGNIDSIYPSTYGKSAGDSNAPFFDSARLAELPDPADLLAAGDFDADGHCDLIAAARDRNRMFLLRGDGKGGLGSAELIELPGKITALTSGEINRADGLPDIVVAVSGAGGPKTIVFEGPEGAARAAPEVLDLPSEARALALGRLDDDPWIDLVVAAGRDLLTVAGRDRQPSIDLDQRSQVHAATIQRQSCSFLVESLVLGDFSGDGRLEIALMGDDGKVRLLERKGTSGGTALPRTERSAWRQIGALGEIIDSRPAASANLLVRARLSSLPKDNLLVLDQSRLQMHLVAFDGSGRMKGVVPLASPKQPLMVDIDADAGPVAVLPMRLNADAVNDLAVLRRGHQEPSLLITPAGSTFTVTSVADLPDTNPGDGVCDIGTSICTLRAAIQEANANPGLDTITFSIGSGTPSIIVGSGGFGALPLISEAVTIIGNSGGATRVELNGSVAGPAATGLSISSGSTTVRGLVINRFPGGEIVLTNNGGNTIEGCIIGANAGGTAGFLNPGDGVSVINVPGNTIGGASAAAGNIISGNALGVHIDGAQSTGNTVQGNFIGTRLLGNAALANVTGVVVSGGASNTSIGGAIGITRNVISGNTGDGVELSSQGNLVQQNYIGLDSIGFGDLGNAGPGVRALAGNNTIGGTAFSGNIISGNDGAGVLIASSSNLIQGNFIGTNSGGNAKVPNATDGVLFESGSGNTVGGTVSGARNVISGNNGNGISVTAPGASNLIVGNFIGLDSGGNSAVGNTLSGVAISGALNTVGGVTPSARNIISGNLGPGLLIRGGAAQNLVQGNFIGPNVAGNLTIGNLSSGVSIDLSVANRIGGTAVGARNVISGNAGNGLQIINGSMGNFLEGNFIGTDLNGVASLPNTGRGIFLSVDSASNTVGGTAPGAGNTIAFNFVGGVVVGSSALSGNAILGNSIRQNTGLGIDLNADGITVNDLGDGDGGPNGLQNFPILTSANSGGAGTVIAGNLNSTAGSVFRVEFFSSVSCDAAGNGEGQVFVGSTTVTTDGAGNGSVNVTLPTVIPGGRQLTATATNQAGNTSEFSPCVVVLGLLAASADISVTKLANPDPVAAGNGITYTVRVTNSGPDEAINAALTENIPANTTFQSLQPAPGWTCTTPPAGGAGTITCTHPDLLSGTISTFVIGVQVGLATPSGTIITNTASASSTVADPNPGNNSAGTSTLVSGSAPCVFTCGPGQITVPTKDAQCGAIVKYPNLTTTGSCGAITCLPPSDSFFPVGVSVVTCTTAAGPSCSFAVRVEDRTPPLITCPANVVQPLDPNLPSAVVNYPIPVVTDNCPGRFMVCSPPAGSTFPAGVTPVSCRVTDSANNVAACSFTVTVNDTQPPGLSCPANIVINSQPGQCSLTVNYPAPTVTDNLPGATATCAPASGSAFAVGITTVACMATDASGNRTSCSFTVMLNGGPGEARITIPSGKSAVEFGNPVPIRAGRKPAKVKKTPCSNFTIDNIGFTPLVLTLEAILRTGSDVDGRKITDADDSKFFSVSLVNSDQSLTLLSPGSVVTIQPCQSRSFCARFNPSIPALAGKTTGLSADEVVPDAVTSAIMFRQAGGSVVAVNLLGHVDTGLVLINPDNPRKPPLLNMSRSGDEFIISYSLFDSNMDVKSAKYELLDGGGRLVGEAFDIDLVQPVRDLNLVRGQSFGVQQRFSGASSHPEVVAARVTLTDGQTSVTATVQMGQTSAAAAALVSYSGFGAVVVFPEALSLTR